MNNQFLRTTMLIGQENLEKLKKSHVAIFGIGGVGGYTVEALARSGIGMLDLIDNDIVDTTNLNRQIIALNSTIGKDKVEVAAQRIKDINPNIQINTFKLFFNNESLDTFDFSKYDYIVDAIDTVTSKLLLINEAEKLNIPIISCMGTGNKLSPELLEVSDIYKTSVCPLARVIRHELKKMGIKKLKVVYSKEQPIKIELSDNFNKPSPASIAFVPAVAGLIIAGEVIKDIIK